MSMDYSGNPFASGTYGYGDSSNMPWWAMQPGMQQPGMQFPGSSGGFGNWWSQNGAGIGAGIGGAIGAIGAGMGDRNLPNPANSAMPYLNQIPGELNQYMSPYISAGQGALGQLQGQYGQLINNPAAITNKIGATYQSSPGYNFQVNQALGAANRAAAAGGMLGTPMEQQNIAGTVNQLANQDYGQYMNRELGLYGAGLSGLGNINQMGFGASSDLSNSLADYLMSQGNLAYAGQINQNQNQAGSNGAMWGGIGSLIGAALPAVASFF